MSPAQHHKYRDGITIEDRWASRGQSGKRWVARVRDTRQRRYKSKSFHELVPAKAWAKNLRARMELLEAGAGIWSIAEVLKDFVALLKQQGRSEGYIATAERMARLLESVGVCDLAEDGLRAKVRTFLALPTNEDHRRRKSEAPAASTVRTRLTYARMLVAHAMRHLGMKTDPLRGFVWSTRTGGEGASRPSDQETYELDEVRAVLALNRRDDAIWLAFVVAIFSGLRAFELHGLRWESIDWATRVLRVARGKGSKSRHVPLQPELYDFLRKLGGPDADRPRLGSMFNIARDRLIVLQLRPLLIAAGVKWDRGLHEITGLPRRLTWHACRRTCAAASLAAGVDSLEIQRSLGHEELEMTGEYCGAHARWKAVVAAEGWPRGRLCLFPAHSLADGAAVKSAD